MLSERNCPSGGVDPGPGVISPQHSIRPFGRRPQALRPPAATNLNCPSGGSKLTLHVPARDQQAALKFVRMPQVLDPAALICRKCPTGAGYADPSCASHEMVPSPSSRQACAYPTASRTASIATAASAAVCTCRAASSCMCRGASSCVCWGAASLAQQPTAAATNAANGAMNRMIRIASPPLLRSAHRIRTHRRRRWMRLGWSA